MVRNPKYTLELEEFVRLHMESAQNSNRKISDKDLNQHIKAKFGEEFAKGQLTYLRGRFRNGELGIGNPNHRTAAIAASMLPPPNEPPAGNAVSSVIEYNPPNFKTQASLRIASAQPVKATPQIQAPETHPYPTNFQVFPELHLPPADHKLNDELIILNSKSLRIHYDYPGITHFGDTSSSESSSPAQLPQDLTNAYQTLQSSALLPPKPSADILPQSQVEQPVPKDPMIGQVLTISNAESVLSTGPLTLIPTQTDGHIDDDIRVKTSKDPLQGGDRQLVLPKIGFSDTARQQLMMALEPVDAVGHLGPTKLSQVISSNPPSNSNQKLQPESDFVGTIEQDQSQSSHNSAQQSAGSNNQPPRASTLQPTTKSLSPSVGTTLKANTPPSGNLMHPLPPKPVIDAAKSKRLKPASWQEQISAIKTASVVAQTSIASAQEANIRMSKARSFPPSPMTGQDGFPGINSKTTNGINSHVSQAGCPWFDILGPNTGLPNLGGLTMPSTLSRADGQMGIKRRFSQLAGRDATMPGLPHPSIHHSSASKSLASHGSNHNYNKDSNDGRAVAGNGRVESRSFFLGASKDGIKGEPPTPKPQSSPMKLPLPSPRAASGIKSLLKTQSSDIVSDGRSFSDTSTPEHALADVTMTMDDALVGLSKYTDEELTSAALLGNDNDIVLKNDLVAAGGSMAQSKPANRIEYSSSSGPMTQDTPGSGTEPNLSYYVVPPGPGFVDVRLCGTDGESCPISPAVIHFHCRRNGTVIFNRMGDFQAAAIMYQRSQQIHNREGPEGENAKEG